MSEPGSFPNPFEGMLGDLAKMLGSLSAEGPVNWDMARQFALWVASEGQSEPNVDPVERIRLEELLRLAEALGELPEAQREALVLQHWHGWSLAQIGQHLGRSPAAVAGLLHRGLRQLRQELHSGE